MTHQIASRYQVFPPAESVQALPSDLDCDFLQRRRLNLDCGREQVLASRLLECVEPLVELRRFAVGAVRDGHWADRRRCLPEQLDQLLVVQLKVDLVLPRLAQADSHMTQLV